MKTFAVQSVNIVRSGGLRILDTLQTSFPADVFSVLYRQLCVRMKDRNDLLVLNLQLTPEASAVP